MGDYAAYLIADGKWRELAVHFDDDHESGNSHSLVLDSYLRMLDVFRPIWADKIMGIDRGRYSLNEDELRELVLAVYHPDRRPDRGQLAGVPPT